MEVSGVLDHLAQCGQGYKQLDKNELNLVYFDSKNRLDLQQF